MLPFMLIMFPFTLMAKTLIAVLRSEKVMLRFEAERISRRLPVYALINVGLAAASLVALIVNAIILHVVFLAGDFLFCLCSLIILCSCAFVFYKTRKIKAIKRI